MSSQLSNIESISPENIQASNTAFVSDERNLMLMNTINNVGIEKASLNRKVVNETNHHFNNKVDDWDVMDQKQSGRCWIFAGMNLFKPGLCKKLNVKDIKLSSNYIQFWTCTRKLIYFLIT